MAGAPEKIGRRSLGIRSGSLIFFVVLIFLVGMFLNVLGREFQDRLSHFFAGLEFDHGALRNRNVRARIVWISAHAGFADFDFKDTEVSQFDLSALGHRFGDVVKGLLDDIQHLLLDQIGFVADANDKVSFGHKVFGFKFYRKHLTQLSWV